MTDEEPPHDPPIDWRLTTWEGARREALRRWSQLPLERIVAALEEMAELQRSWRSTPGLRPESPRPNDRGEQQGGYTGHCARLLPRPARSE